MKSVITKCILLITSIFLSSANTFADDKYKISWELENPFKFFTDSNDSNDMKNIYDNVEANSAKNENSKGLAFERALQSNKWKNGKYIKQGWATHFAINKYSNTCWDQKTMSYKDEYIHPYKHNIKFKLNTPNNEMCSWYVDGKKEFSDTLCSQEKIFPLQYTPQSKHIVEAFINDGAQKVSETIIIEDVLIVGLGDSYASGEGNPDIPIKRDNMTPNKDMIWVKNRYLPRKEKDNNATWLDRRAHRSLYSYQFKTALQYALENPQKAVTFVSFSSSGAVADHIMTERKPAVEHLKRIEPRYDENRFVSGVPLVNKEMDRTSYIRQQITLLKNTIGERKADVLLLSIGGNDIGFAKYVMNVMHASPMNIGSKKPTEKTKYKVDSILFDKYYRLDNELKKYLKENDSRRIILTAYPDVLKDENQTLCKGDRREFIVPFGVSEKRKNDINDTEEYLIKPLYEIQKNLAGELGWSFVDGHRVKYDKHGFCAKNFNSSNKANEQFVMPYKLHEDDKKWISFQPEEYKPYASKQRWVNLPVDSILTINRTQNWAGLRTDFGFTDESSGIFHPTAEGLAVEADENLNLIYEKFGK